MERRIWLKGSRVPTVSNDVTLIGIILQDNYMVDAKLANFAIAYDLGRDPMYR